MRIAPIQLVAAWLISIVALPLTAMMDDADVHVFLEDAIWNTNKQGVPYFRRLQLDFKVRDGQWEEAVYGYAVFYGDNGQYESAFNKADHEGRLTDITDDGSTITLTVEATINGDPWVPGGPASYVITLTRENDTLTGSYTGSMRESPVSGSARAEIHGPFARPIPDHVPFLPGEHPRLILRQSQLDWLRNVAVNTPEGQRMVERLDSTLNNNPYDGYERAPAWIAAGRAFKFLLTEDPAWEQSTRAMVDEIMQSNLGSLKMIRRAPRYMGVALAYDMMYNHWEATDPDYRRQVAHWLEDRMFEIVAGGGDGYNSHPHSNWMGIAYGSLGVIAMALLDDPAPFYHDEPLEPTLGTGSPVSGYVPGAGVPAADPATFNDGQPLDWMLCGPFVRDGNDDILAPLGGAANALPEIGTSVTYNGQTQAFTSIGSQHTWNDSTYTGGLDYLDVINPISHTYFTTSYYYTVIDVTGTNRWFELDYAFSGEGQLATRAWLAGVPVADQAILQLPPGKYPLMVEASVTQLDPWGVVAVRTALVEHTQAEAQGLYNQLHDEWNIDHAAWQVLYDDYVAKGERSYYAKRFLDFAEQGARRFLMTGLGRNGWHIEGHGYLRFTLTAGMGQYLHGLKTAMGLDMATTTGADMMLPLVTASAIDGDVAAYGPGGWSDLRAMWEERSGVWNSCFSTVRPEYRSGIHAKYLDLFGPSGNNTYNIAWPYQAAYAFANFPWGETPGNMTDSLPRQTGEHWHGLFMFRDGYRTDYRDSFALLYSKSRYGKGSHQASDSPEFRLYGSGEHLATLHPVNAGVSPNGHQGADILSFRAATDGSGIVKMDVSPYYWGSYDKSSNTYADQGVAATRSFAADLSGISGSSALFAVHDQVTGGTPVWELDCTTSPAINGRTFTVSRNGSVLKGWLVLPETGSFSSSGTKVRATGTGEYLVVMAVQSPGASNAVVSSGVATLGGQQVSVEDGKIVLGHFDEAPVAAPAFEMTGSGDQLRLTMPTQAGVRYRLRSSVDLQSWTEEPITLTGNGLDMTQLIDMPQTGHLFYHWITE